MVHIKIVNKVESKIEEQKNITGTTKTWMAEKMGYKSLQAFNKAIKNESNSLVTYAKFAYFLKCKETDLYEIIYKETN